MTIRSIRISVSVVVALFFPFVTLAADSIIGGVVVSSQGSTELSASTTYTLDLQASSGIPAGTTLSILVNEQGTEGAGPEAAGFTFTDAPPVSDTAAFEAGTVSLENNGAMYQLLVGEVSAGEHTITLGVNNSANAGTYFFVVTTETAIPPTNTSQSGTFTLGDAGDDGDGGGGDATNVVTGVSVSSTNSTVGESSDYTFTITTNATLGNGDVLDFYFSSTNELNFGPNASGFSFAGVVPESDDLTITNGMAIGEGDTLLEATLGATATAGTYTVVLTGVTNSSAIGEYVAAANSGGADLADQAVQSDPFMLTEAEEGEGTAPARPKKKQLSVLQLKQRTAMLKWAAVDSATSYTVRVDRKTGSWEKVKVFKNVSKTKKNLKKQFTKAGARHRFRVKACNDAGCSKWSKPKVFTMQSAS